MVGSSLAVDLTQNLKMSDSFTTAVTAVIPVIILSAVLEANVYAKRGLEAVKRDADALAAVDQEAAEYLARGEEVPIDVARRYKAASADGLRTRAYGWISAVWVITITLLSCVELADLYVLAQDIEDKDLPGLVLVNLGVVFLGFCLLILLPVAARATEVMIEEYLAERESSSPRLTAVQARALLARVNDEESGDI
jgi:hypothetical protein